MYTTQASKKRGSKEQRLLREAGFTIHPQRKFKPGVKNKWLTDLLKTIGYSEDRFGAMLGVSRNVIANIKNGKSRLNPKLAQKIYVATGAYVVPYFRGNDAVLSPSEKPYTKATFENWRTHYSDTDEKSVGEFFRYASDTLFVLLAGASRYKLKNQLPALRQSFFDWCVDSYKSFMLEKPIAEFLKEERKFFDELKMTYGDWRHPEMEDDRKYYGFKDNKAKSDSEELTLRIEAWPGWFPIGNMKREKIESRHVVMKWK